MLASVQKVFQQGDYQKTENELDIAIEGNGFLQVTLPSGETAYTRAGALKSDAEGRIVTTDGYPIVPNITIPAQTLTYYPSKQMEQYQPRSRARQRRSRSARLNWLFFSNPIRTEGNRKKPLSSRPMPVVRQRRVAPGQNGVGTMLQGYLEGSNVNIMQEMINLIVGQRAYEVNSKAIQAADEMLQMANALRR